MTMTNGGARGAEHVQLLERMIELWEIRALRDARARIGIYLSEADALEAARELPG